MKKLIYAAPVLALGSAFAETGGETSTVDWTNIADSAETSLGNVVSGLAPMVGAIVALVAGCRLLAKLINRAVGK